MTAENVMSISKGKLQRPAARIRVRAVAGVTLLIGEGAGNAGCWPQPMARQQKEKLAAVTTGSAKSSGIPCTMVLTLISRSPWEPGYLAPITREIIILRA